MSDYEIQVSQNGKDYRPYVRFNRGDKSRFEDALLDDALMIKEVNLFKQARSKSFPYIRLIINF